jgi:diguanylate cyclase (GGDEF)-like protein
MVWKEDGAVSMNRTDVFTKEKKLYGAFSVSCIVAFLTAASVMWAVFGTPHGKGPAGIGAEAFKYFTVISNLMAGASSFVMAHYTGTHINKKREIRIPGWLYAFRLASVTSVMLTFFTVLFVLAPTYPTGFFSLYTGCNLFLHSVIPLLSLLGMVLFEGCGDLGYRAVPLAAAPMLVYAPFYAIPIFSDVSSGGAVAEGHDWYGFCKNGLSGLFVFFAAALLGSLLFGALLILLCRLAERIPVKSELIDMRASTSMESGGFTADEFYKTRVIKLVCILAPCVGVFSSLIITVLALLNRFSISYGNLLVLDAFCLTYAFVGLYLYRTCIGADGMAIKTKILFGEHALTVLLIIHWNIISYLAPFREFWAFSLLFVLLAALFLDCRVLLINEGAILLSMALSWIIRGDKLLPVRGENFVNELVFRIEAVLLEFLSVFVIVFLINRLLLKELDRMSDYDVLTHAMNRRKLARYMDAFIRRHHENGTAFSVAIFDLDNFKKVNDTYGHASGDIVLKEFVRIIYTNTKSDDMVFRFGGEEFLVLFACDIDKAERSCNRIIAELARKSFPFMEDKRITATAGLAAYTEGVSREELVIRADQRLYAGKASGKNKVISDKVSEENVSM